MLESFSCSNFRNVAVNDMKFGRVNLLIGPNNSGKTNLIQALSFSADMVNSANRNNQTGFLSEVQRNGSSSMLCRNGDNPYVDLKWKIALQNHLVDYSLGFRLGKDESECYITSEALNSAGVTHGGIHPLNLFCFYNEKPEFGMISTALQSGKPYRRIPVLADQDESVLLQFGKLLISNQALIEESNIRTTLFSIVEELQSYFSKFYSYRSSQFDFEQIRQLRDPNYNGKSLFKDGSNFINVYLQASKNDPDFKDRFCFKMQSIIPDLDYIEVVEGLGKVGMKLCIGNSSYYLSEVSDGTIEALLLALLISLPDKQAPSLLAIDEPEANLHPAWQAALAKWIQTSGNVKQCFISTHSPDFLDSFTDDYKNEMVNIFVWDGTGNDTFKPLDYNCAIGKLENGWMLGDLCRANFKI